MRPRLTSAEGGASGIAVLTMLWAVVLLGEPAGSSPANYRLCGKHLADILSLICKGRGFHDPFAHKPPNGRGEPYQESRYGVSDECCKMGCTRATMERYCSEEPDYGGTEIGLEYFGDRQGIPSWHGSVRHEAEGSATAEVSTGSKVSRGEGRRKGNSGHGGRGRGWARARGGNGKRCRCKRRRRKTDAEMIRRQLTHTSFQIGTIPPNFLGPPVILSRTKSRVIS